MRQRYESSAAKLKEHHASARGATRHEARAAAAPAAASAAPQPPQHKALRPRARLRMPYSLTCVRFQASQPNRTRGVACEDACFRAHPLLQAALQARVMGCGRARTSGSVCVCACFCAHQPPGSRPHRGRG